MTSFDKTNVIVSGSRSAMGEYANYTTVIPKPTLFDGHMVLTQSMISKPNTKYVIKWNFDLNGTSITIPQGCLIEFDGGSFSNGTLVGNNTILMYKQPIEEVLDVTLSGTFIYDDGQIDKIDNANGMGKIYLKKDKSFASQITQPNTTYVIQYDFTLTGDVTIPANCVLEFDGGSVSGHKIYVNETTSIINNTSSAIFKSCVLAIANIDYPDTTITHAGYSHWFDDTDSNVFASLSCFDEAHLEKDLTFNYIPYVTVFRRAHKDIHFFGHNHSLTVTHTDEMSNQGTLFGIGVYGQTEAHGVTIFVRDVKITTTCSNPDIIITWTSDPETNTYNWFTAFGPYFYSNLDIENVTLDTLGASIIGYGTTSNVERNNYLRIVHCDIIRDCFLSEYSSKHTFIEDSIIRRRTTKTIHLNDLLSICDGGIDYDIHISNSTIHGGIEISYQSQYKVNIDNCILSCNFSVGVRDTAPSITDGTDVIISNCTFDPSTPITDFNNFNGLDNLTITNSRVVTNHTDNGWINVEKINNIVFDNCYLKNNAYYTMHFNTDNIQKVTIRNSYCPNTNLIWFTAVNAGGNAGQALLSKLCLDNFRAETERLSIQATDDVHECNLMLNGCKMPLFGYQTGLAPLSGQNGSFGWYGGNINNLNDMKYMGKIVVMRNGIGYDALGNLWTNKYYGETTERPSGQVKIGFCFFDTNLGTNGKPIYYAGQDGNGQDVWVDATGTQV